MKFIFRLCIYLTGGIIRCADITCREYNTFPEKYKRKIQKSAQKFQYGKWMKQNRLPKFFPKNSALRFAFTKNHDNLN